MSTIQSM